MGCTTSQPAENEEGASMTAEVVQTETIDKAPEKEVRPEQTIESGTPELIRKFGRLRRLII